jgi:hypothetical protein
MHTFIPSPVYACSSCGGGKITNTSIQGSQVQQTSQPVKTIKSAPAPRISGVSRRTI